MTDSPPPPPPGHMASPGLQQPTPRTNYYDQRQAGSARHIRATGEAARRELDNAHVEQPFELMETDVVNDSDYYDYALETEANEEHITQPVIEGEETGTIHAIAEEAVLRHQQTNLRGIEKTRGTDNVSKDKENTEITWDRLRRWLWSHPEDEDRAMAARVRGQNDSTAMHLICKLYNPPPDVVQALAEAAPETLEWTDSHGWLPLHHACANGAPPDTMRILVDMYPAGKLQPDHQRRTPLHFYATRATDNPANMAINAEMLSDTGAAGLTDAGGMLPMHYACAYGTHPALLAVLTEAYPDSLTAQENHGRTPMHLAMVNAHRDASPGVVRFLIAQQESRQTINARDRDGYLPIHLMALGLKGYRTDDHEKRTNASECLDMYLAAEPTPTADFLTAIQDLPEWLQDTAVVSKHVRNILNDKIVQPFPTSILILDGMFLVVQIVCFALSSHNHINMRLSEEPVENTTRGALAILFVAASYHLVRVLLQIASLISFGSVRKWFFNPANWFDMSVIILVLYYASLMVGPGDPRQFANSIAFRTGVTFTQGILWVSIILYLKSTLVDFAVFVGGLFNVVQRLVAFLMAVGVILLAFAQMFFFVYLGTDLCDDTLPLPEGADPALQQCEFPHCEFDQSLLQVYSMMMGEIGEESRYATNFTAQVLYVGYALIVVILLSNVLIAVVTDSYEMIQNDRAAIVFWSNRLNFIAEMDAILYAVRLLMCAFGFMRNKEEITEKISFRESIEEIAETESPNVADRSGKIASVEFFREVWYQMMLLFDEHLYQDADWIESWVYNVLRLFCIFVLIPLWLVVGFASAGWLWPPQVREYLFIQREVMVSRSELERKKLEKLKTIHAEIKSIKQEILREISADREDMIRMRSEVETIQSEVLADLTQIKELMQSIAMLS